MVSPRVKHLWWRAGFGVPLNSGQFTSEKELLRFLIHDAGDVRPLNTVVEMERPADFLRMTPDEKATAVRKKSEVLRQLNADWFSRLVSNQGVLREKMTLFWANHFSCRSGSAEFTIQLNNIIRKNAIGDFKMLLLEVSKSPAMLQFLNNQQNRKAHPNENFAREVMELFTLGRGAYSEQDIREAARAFTGWSFDPSGNFVFRERVHDAGEKTILGVTGYHNGEDVIRILLQQTRTARFIVEKFWKCFVSDVPDKQRVDQLAEDFYKSDYNILSLIRNVFDAPWFYEPAYMGELIKSPVELMVPLMRDFKVRFENNNVLLGMQKVLGQVLFNPPNVAGWPGGRNWINSSSLAIRMRTPSVLIKDEMPEFESKDDGDANNPFGGNNGKGNLKTVADWSLCFGKWDTIEQQEILNEIADWLLVKPLTADQLRLAEKYIKRDSRDEQIRSTIMFLTALPEYQLC